MSVIIKENSIVEFLKENGVGESELKDGRHGMTHICHFMKPELFIKRSFLQQVNTYPKYTVVFKTKEVTESRVQVLTSYEYAIFSYDFISDRLSLVKKSSELPIDPITEV